MTGQLNPDAIPLELRERQQWVCWRFKQRAGEKKPTKVPFIPGTDAGASSTDPTTWRTFPEALAAYQRGRYDGIGYVFAADDPYVGIDLDDARDHDSGRLQPWAQGIIGWLDSYTEHSVSGSGVHIIARGELPAGGRKRQRWEMYADGRFFVFTGCVVDGCRSTIEDRSEAIAQVHTFLFPPTLSKRETEQPAPSLRAVSIPAGDRFAAAQRDEKFRHLHSGDTGGYPGPSEARFAFLAKAASYSGCDTGLMDTWFRSSGLNQRKWDSKRRTGTLGSFEIDKAIAGCTWTYDPTRPREPDPAPPTALERIQTSGSDGAQGCPTCWPMAAQNAELLAENARLQGGFTALGKVLKIPNEALPAARKVVAIVATFDLMSQESRQNGANHRLYGKVIAERAGVVLSTAVDTLKWLSGHPAIFERHEVWVPLDKKTGEVFDSPRRDVSYRPLYPNAPATFDALVTAMAPQECPKHPNAGPVLRCAICRDDERAERAKQRAAKAKPPALCKDHPEDGTVIRCATCFASVGVGTAADPKRKRPSGLEDYMGEQPPLPLHVVTYPEFDLDQMGDVEPHPRPERLVELGASIGYPALIVNRRVTIPAGRDAWQGFAAVANGSLGMAIAAAVAYEPPGLRDQMGGIVRTPPTAAPPSLDEEFEQVVRASGGSE